MNSYIAEADLSQDMLTTSSRLIDSPTIGTQGAQDTRTSICTCSRKLFVDLKAVTWAFLSETDFMFVMQLHGIRLQLQVRILSLGFLPRYPYSNHLSSQVSFAASKRARQLRQPEQPARPDHLARPREGHHFLLLVLELRRDRKPEPGETVRQRFQGLRVQVWDLLIVRRMEHPLRIDQRRSG